MWAKWAEPVQLYVVRNALVVASTTIVVRDDAMGWPLSEQRQEMSIRDEHHVPVRMHARVEAVNKCRQRGYALCGRVCLYVQSIHVCVTCWAARLDLLSK